MSAQGHGAHVRAPAPAGDTAGFRYAALWTAASAIVPGSGLLAAGRRASGSAVLLAAVLLAAGAGWLATAGRRTALQWSLDPGALLVISIMATAVGIAAALLIIATYVALVPSRLNGWQRTAGGVLVSALALAVAVPAFAVMNLARTQGELVGQVFADDRRSATVPAAATVAAEQPEPFAGQDRVNVLLLGGDGGDGRDGVRTDSVIVASIETATGATTLFSLPRNLEQLPFPADSPLRRIYPNGFDGEGDAEGSDLLNAVYRLGPAEHPDVLGVTDDPGADFLKLGVGEALGMTIDYFVLVNLDGFAALIDSLGGISVDVNYWVPVGGEPTTGRLPDAYIAPGPAQRMDGATALAFSRARFGASDYQRMDRQRCVIDDIVEAVDPLTLPLRYSELAATTQDIVSTDVPREVLDDVVELGLRVRETGVRSVVFDDTLIESADPDYDDIRALVRQALAAPPAAIEAAGTAAPGSAGTTGPAATSPALPPATAGPVIPGATPRDGAGASPGAASASPPPVEEAADVCTYDPVQAAAARAEGSPPTYGD